MKNVLIIDTPTMFRNSITPKLGINHKKTLGRNNRGKITTRYFGGGVKNLFLEVQFWGSGYLESICSGNNRESYIAWCRSSNGFGFFRLINNNNSLKLGDFLGSAPLKTMVVGDSISCVPSKVGSKGLIARAVGSFCRIIRQESSSTVIRIPSGKILRLDSSIFCFKGLISGFSDLNRKTAGYNRRIGIRPKVKGVSMNPIDHSNGGKTKSSKIKNIFGKLAKWNSKKCS